MGLRWILLLAVFSIASADTLTLRNGQIVQGSYLGGTSRQVRMVVGDAIRTFEVSEISSIQFEHGEPATPAAPAAAATPAPPEPNILRPEPSAATAPPAPVPAPAPAAAAEPAAVGSEIPAGANIVVRMIDDVDSKVNRVGQTFRGSVDEPVMVGDNVVIPKGTDVTTKLVELKDPNKITGGGQLTLDLDSVTVNGKPIDVNAQGVTTTGESRKGQSAKVIGGTAALGAIIGAIAGGGKGAAIGAVSGAGAGTAVQVLTQGTRVRVPSETRLTFTLQHAVRIQ
jgi:hypothetical protein